jgi:hypothetical protein
MCQPTCSVITASRWSMRVVFAAGGPLRHCIDEGHLARVTGGQSEGGCPCETLGIRRSSS